MPEEPDGVPRWQKRLAELGPDDDERFVRAAEMARRHFEVPIACLSLVEPTRQRFVGSVPLPRSNPLEDVVCPVAITHDGPFVVSDLADDPRFADSQLVAEEPRLRFYAGLPLHAPDGVPFGTFCIMDTMPRGFSRTELADFVDLGRWVQRELLSYLADAP